MLLCDIKIPAKHSNNYHIAGNYVVTSRTRCALENDGVDHSDWIVIAAFYQAVHWIDAYLLTRKYKPKNHDTRQTYMGRCPDLYCITNYYTSLKDASEDARYRKKSYEYDSTGFEEAVKKSCIIVAHVKKLMGIP